ncbi:MAG TPA: GtrA family protein [Chroococcales cyanobacterium]
MSGIAAVGTDMITYHCFLPVLGPSPAKAVSFIAGTCIAYLLQKYWTFKMKEQCVREMSKFGLLYGSSLLLNVGVNKLVLCIPLFIPLFEMHRVGLAWLSATGFSTIYNYVGQKFWVFKGAKH